MQLNLPMLTLCLLGTVILCGAQDNNQTFPPTNETTAPPTEPTGNLTTLITPAITENSTTPDGPATNPTVPETVNTTTVAAEGPSHELSDGAIAGIAIGSIAGVAALGGGVFGALKYTGKF